MNILKSAPWKSNKTGATCELERYWREDMEHLAGLPEMKDRLQ